MQFFKSVDINFIENRRKFFVISILLLLTLVVVSICKGGPNYGIDFTGGVLMQVSFQDGNVNLKNVRSAIEEAGIKSFELQSSEKFVMVRAKKNVGSLEEFENVVKSSIQSKFEHNTVTVEKVEYVGPSVGKHLSKQAIYAFLFAFLGMIVYIAFRFKSGFWGVSAVVGVVFDVMASFGFVILANKEVSIIVVAALLTVAGYSINDTIVLFDRIKENLKLYAKESFAAIMNKSINQVLVRTVVTSLTVFLMSCSLFLVGGEVLHTFAYIMVIGTVLGVFSSIFICTALVYECETRRINRIKLSTAITKNNEKNKEF